MGRRVLRSLVAWAPFAILVTMVAGLAYALDQQNLRSGANDPQIQLAEDAAARLDAGATATSVVSSAAMRVDIARSLAPFLIVYDLDDKPLASNAALDGAIPVPPQGVTTSARTSENRVTWQPRNAVRIAAVVVAYRGGAVLAGRSLRVVEQRADDALIVTGVLWSATMVLTWLAVLGASVLTDRRTIEGGRRPPHAAP